MSKRPLLLLLLVLPILLVQTACDAEQAEAVDEAEPDPCAAIADAAARLSCFDSLAGVETRPDPAPIDPGAGAWSFDESTDPLTDARRAIGILEAEQGVSRFGRPVSLFVRCNGGTLDVYLNWDSYLGRDAFVTSRVGDGSPSRSRWGMSTDNTSTFYPRDARALLRELRPVAQWVVQVTPYSASPITAVFDLEGLEELVSFMEPTCEV